MNFLRRECAHRRSESILVADAAGASEPAVRCCGCGNYRYTSQNTERPQGWIAPPGLLDGDRYHDAIRLLLPGSLDLGRKPRMRDSARKIAVV
jgi:hypothetical protein